MSGIAIVKDKSGLWAARQMPKGGRWSEEKKRALCRVQGLTLNGLPARISMRHPAFAYVEQLETGLGAEWSWAAAARIVRDKGGHFNT